MTSASDGGAHDGGSSPLALRLHALREAVLAEWERRVRAEVAAAGKLAHPILIDTMPMLYDNLVQALDPDYPRTSADVATPSAAVEHGGERARLTRYEAQEVIFEYQILRETVFAFAGRDGAQVAERDTLVINSAIDAAIREAVTAFALVQAAFREQFFAALAHDLRGPLSSANISAQLIGMTDDIDTIRRHAVKVRENIGRVDEMIAQMLDALVFQHGERLSIAPTAFDLRDLVREVCAHMTLLHGPRFEVRGGSVAGWWGRPELQRALENLVSNALKYGDAGRPVRIRYWSEHGRALLSVHNEGNPIPADQVESVFQVFRRAEAAKRGKEGWGIGLPYVRSVAESHGGSIGVDSAPERGTTFTIDIPVDARPFMDAPTL